MVRTKVFLAQALLSLALTSFVKNFHVQFAWRYVMNPVQHLVDTVFANKVCVLLLTNVGNDVQSAGNLSAIGDSAP
ncbi:uncharacterized protein LOC142549876 isoform X3 [Primulina tabacum]|uniref:uncharacterized protein LOC142549876 isoform X3 n=1 Tax=Primulina tabacum TaxID=48773 RepID=UPI003F5A96FC